MIGNSPAISPESAPASPPSPEPPLPGQPRLRAVASATAQRSARAVFVMRRVLPHAPYARQRPFGEVLAAARSPNGPRAVAPGVAVLPGAGCGLSLGVAVA